ncbi:hypothetical protein BDV97DRAFT_199726 [Delphinella strobiligena]|nr:hypothetical protein BDV97DRAFT_199726 [Delphinella strobiligena]
MYSCRKLYSLLSLAPSPLFELICLLAPLHSCSLFCSISLFLFFFSSLFFSLLCSLASLLTFSFIYSFPPSFIYLLASTFACWPRTYSHLG